MGHIPVENMEAAKILLDELGKLIEVPIGSLAIEVKLHKILTVPMRDLDNSDLPAHAATEGVIEPFTYDLIYILETLSDKKLWREKWIRTPGAPMKEEELADFIMGMNLMEFLSFFAPLISLRQPK